MRRHLGEGTYITVRNVFAFTILEFGIRISLGRSSDCDMLEEVFAPVSR